jgi:DNA repair exonuclease SbcCD ATPase subunit
MILEGFEIENWSCIKRVAVDGLASSGLIVLHGPNGTGKSSIIEALRACLMDNKSTSRALDRGFPKNSSDKPRVSVVLRAAGTTWRIAKQFGTKDSKLESKTATGQWKLETADPSEAHERTRQLTGGCDSSLGLHQLLWLTQAEFRLPDPKKFDADVQSRLRAVLGVLQTPLDDRFLARVKEGWSRWFGARSKPGEKPKLKKDCGLDKALAFLKVQETELGRLETEYQDFERMMKRAADLEVQSRNLRRQLHERTASRDDLQNEYEKSLARLEAHRLSLEKVGTQDKALADALALQRRRADVEHLLCETRKLAEKAKSEAEEQGRRLQAAEGKLRDLRHEVQELENGRRQCQDRVNDVADRRQQLMLHQQLATARERLQQAEHLASELEVLRTQAREHPAPDSSTVKKLEENRIRAGQLRADLEAAAIALTLVPDPGAPAPRLTIDGASAFEAAPPNSGMPVRHFVRRQAQIAIPGWGRANLSRGSDARSVDAIEGELKELDRKFADGVAPFGVPARDAAALDQLRHLAAEKKLRDPELQRKQDEIVRLAPQGLDPLRQEVAGLDKTRQANEAVAVSQPGRPPLPSDAAELDSLAGQLKKDIKEYDTSIATLALDVRGLEREIDGDPPVDSKSSAARPRADKFNPAASGLRRQEAAARDQFTQLGATAEVHRLNLERLPTTEQLVAAVKDAEQAAVAARDALASAKLTDNETTIRERLDSANEGLRALQWQLSAVEKEFHQIEGALRLTEGLHQKRAAAAARVEELTRQTEREQLQSEAFNRLYAVFEECREKQFGAVMGPIHDRVLRWMRLLRIGDYHSIGFNDQFLPEKLMAGDGTAELLLAEESTGTIEQIGLMVRLALGSLLSTADEPAVAILDDPLTHSDVVRLDRMRAVLKNATLGDPATKPPAGPLQIVVFTCHPEWFAIDGAKVIDLSRPEMLRRN